MKTDIKETLAKAKDQTGKDWVILFKLGDFYEAFDSDAVAVSKIIGLTLTSRGRGNDEIRMAGFPHHELDRNLIRLVNADCKVAVIENPEDGPASTHGKWSIWRNGRLYDVLNPIDHDVRQHCRQWSNEYPKDKWSVQDHNNELVYEIGPAKITERV